MAYVPPVFLEHSMSEAQKLTALNTLETQYDEAVSYIDAMMHDSNYYTETEMDDTFYRSPDHPDGRSDTGHGSGVDAAKVDGFTLSALRAQALPPGCITFWTLSAASIPAGWELYSAAKDKFIIAAGTSYEEGTESSLDYVTPEISAGWTSAGTALSGTQIARHVHNYTDFAVAQYNFSPTGSTACASIGGITSTTTTVDNIANTSSTAHTHHCTFTWTGYYDENNVLHNGPLDLYPHYKALCWVIKT